MRRCTGISKSARTDPVTGLDRQSVFLGISLVLGMAFWLSGVPKIIGLELPVMEFVVWGYPDWLRILVGCLEIFGGVLLLFRHTLLTGALLLLPVILGAGYTHWVNQEGMELLRPVVYGAVLAIVVWQRRPDLSGLRGQ